MESIVALRTHTSACVRLTIDWPLVVVSLSCCQSRCRFCRLHGTDPRPLPRIGRLSRECQRSADRIEGCGSTGKGSVAARPLFFCVRCLCRRATHAWRGHLLACELDCLSCSFCSCRPVCCCPRAVRLSPGSPAVRVAWRCNRASLPRLLVSMRVRVRSGWSRESAQIHTEGRDGCRSRTRNTAAQQSSTNHACRPAGRRRQLRTARRRSGSCCIVAWVTAPMQCSGRSGVRCAGGDSRSAAAGKPPEDDTNTAGRTQRPGAGPARHTRRQQRKGRAKEAKGSKAGSIEPTDASEKR